MYNIIFTRPFYKIRKGGVAIYLRQLLFNLNKELFNVVNYHSNKSAKLSLKNELATTTRIENIIIKLRVILYLLGFPYKLIKYKVDIVHSNPSFAFIPLIRDGLFVFLSSLFRKKIIVFIHGWRVEDEERIANNGIMLYLFNKIFDKADVIVVLSRSFKRKLSKMGIKTQIVVETTMVDNNLIGRFDIWDKLKNERNKKKITILFLSRIEKTKGIFETVESLIILNRKYKNIELIIAGEGEDLLSLKNYVKNNNISNVRFLGYVRGDEKRNVFLYSDIYLFPTYYPEGMPITVLEAMAFGLPVVTRPVGGLRDFFENGKHGFITDSKSPEDIACLIEKIICNKNLRHKISIYNYEFARKKFLSSAVTKRIESIYLNLVQE